MLQPFEDFKINCIPRLEQLNKTFLVTQTYYRGNNPFTEEQKINILISHYGDKGSANMHWNAVKTDRYAAILDLKKEVHKMKLEEMLAEGSRYHLYWSVVKSNKKIKEVIDKIYKDKIRRYINLNTDWKIGGHKTVSPDIEVQYGEIFIILKYGRYQDIRIKFEEIEKI